MLDRETIRQMEIARIGLPNDDQWLQTGSRLLLRSADLHLTAVADFYRAILDKNTCVLRKPDSERSAAMLIARAQSSAEILEQVSTGEMHLGIVASEFGAQIPANVQVLESVVMPGLSTTTTISGLLVGSEDEIDPSILTKKDLRLRNVVGLTNRLAVKIARGSRQVAAKADLAKVQQFKQTRTTIFRHI